MIANKLKTARSLASRFAVFCLMGVSGTGIALAQENSPLHFAETRIVLGQNNTLELVLTNPDDLNTELKENNICNLNFTLYLPNGVTYDDKKPNNFVGNNERLVDHKLLVQNHGMVEGGKTKVKFAILSGTNAPIQLEDGKIADITLNIDESYINTQDKFILLDEVTLSDPKGNKIFKEIYQNDKVPGEAIKFHEKKYALLPVAGNMYAVEENVTIFNSTAESKPKQTIQVGLDNQIKLKGFQCEIQLPAGVDFAEYNKAGNPVFVGGNRIPNHDFSSKQIDKEKNIWRVIGHSLAGFDIDNVEKSHLFSFDIVADEKFEAGDIKVSHVVLADATGNGYLSTGNEFAIKVKSLSSIYAPVDAQIKALNEELAAAQKHIADNCPNIKEQEWVAAEAQTLDQGIKALEAKLAEAKKGHQQDLKALAEEATQLSAKIKAYQQKGVDTEAAKVANDAAYKELTPAIKAAEEALAGVKKVINEECKDVAAKFAETLAAYDKQVADLKQQVESLNKEMKLTAAKKDEVIKTLNAVKEGAVKLQKEAQEAQKLFADEAAQKAANEKAYKDLSAQVAATQQLLENAQIKVTSECPNVANKYTKNFYDLGKQIEALGAELKAKYDKVELNAESTVAVAPVKEAIEKLVADAEAAQKAYTANEDAYAALTKKLNNVKAEIEDAKAQIMLLCKDVAADYIVLLVNVNREVTTAQDELDVLYKKGELNAESTVNDKELSEKVAKIFADAVEAQKNHDSQNNANEMAYQKLSAELEQLYASVEAAKVMIAEDYFKVADIYNKHFEELIVRLDAVKADLAAKYEAGALNENSELAVEGVAENIQAIVREAMFAANDEAYERLVGEVEVAKTKLAEADQKIKTEWSKVAPDFEGRVAEINTMIQAVLDDLAEKSENVELNSNSSVDLAAVEAAINQLLIDAQEAYISGIEDILVEGKEVVGIYTLGGKRVANPVKGWNIVKYNDGSSKKVYVK